MSDFIVKDSGKRAEFAGGMVRDVNDNKTWWSLVFDGPMLGRWAQHLTKGARKYAKRNWMKAAGEEELERARDSAARHFAQWMAGEVDEDHAAAVYFNINLAEYVKERMAEEDTVVLTMSCPQRGPAPFPMTEEDKIANQKLQKPRGEFVQQENGEVWWVPENEPMIRWDRP